MGQKIRYFKFHFKGGILVNSDQLRQLYKDHKVIIVSTPNQTEQPAENDEPEQTEQPLHRLIQPTIQKPMRPIRRGGCCGKRA
jgi:hypothetical protein